MHRTQIYFDETLFEAIKQRARRANLSISAYIREVLQKELEARLPKFNDFGYIFYPSFWMQKNG